LREIINLRLGIYEKEGVNDIDMNVSFWAKRMHSLTGVVPLGCFLFEHLFSSFLLVFGFPRFIAQVEFLWSMPCLCVLELGLIFLPLAYHAGYGIYLAVTAQDNFRVYPTFANFMFIVQRVSGIVLFIFVVVHLWETRVQKMIYDDSAEQLAQRMVHILASNWKISFYVIGVTAAVIHFCRGLASFVTTWGIVVNPRMQRLVNWGVCTLGVVLLTFGLGALIACRYLGNGATA
jgi:succinate dehydrogenase / fumarate reductase cytochrome b subunit